MNDRIREAYVEHELSLAKAGILDHSLDIAILEGKTVEEHTAVLVSLDPQAEAGDGAGLQIPSRGRRSVAG